MAELMNPGPYSTIYDPACGSGGLLIKARLLFEQRSPDLKSKAPKLYGQELNPVTFAMAKMNMFLHDYTDSSFELGDTFRRPGFATQGAGLKRFDYVVANPMWNQDNYDDSFYDHDTWNRFVFGTPPRPSADWGWAEHMLASLNEDGRAAIVLDTGAVSRGSGGKSSNKERDIRKALVENDFIEGVVLLPENLFYNTTAPGIILLLRRNKPAERKRQILIVNASTYFVKEKPKNVLSDKGIDAVVHVYHKWESMTRFSRVLHIEEARATDYNLSPSQYVEVSGRVKHRTLEEIADDLRVARIERELADGELDRLLARLPP